MDIAAAAADTIERRGHGNDIGRAAWSAANRELRQPTTRLTGKPVTESNQSLGVPTGMPA